MTAANGVNFKSVVDEATSEKAGAGLLRLFARPGSQKESLQATAAGLVLKVRAPATEGKANARLLRVVAELLHVPRSSLSIKSGETARQKVIAIEGRTAAEIAAALVAHHS